MVQGASWYGTRLSFMQSNFAVKSHIAPRQHLGPLSAIPPLPVYMNGTVTRIQYAKCEIHHLREPSQINTDPSLENLLSTGPDAFFLQVLTPATHRFTIARSPVESTLSRRSHSQIPNVDQNYFIISCIHEAHLLTSFLSSLR